jgi:hypothetical protein
MRPEKIAASLMNLIGRLLFYVPLLFLGAIFVIVTFVGQAVVLLRIRLVTVGGFLILFLVIGLGIAWLGLKTNPQGIAGNLVSEAAGAFFAAAAIDGVLLIVESSRKRREEGALKISSKEKSGGDYVVSVRNTSYETVYYVTLHAPNSEWSWSEEFGDWGTGLRNHNTAFSERIPKLTSLEGQELPGFLSSSGESRSVVLFPGGSRQLPYVALVEWENSAGQRFRRRITLHESSPYLF